MSDNGASTLKSYVDSAAGMVQSAVGAVTGNSATKVHTPTPASVLPASIS